MNKVIVNLLFRKAFICLMTICLIPSYVDAQKLTKRRVNKIFKSTLNANHFTGFVLYDQEKKKTIYDQNGDKYFIPASNTKLFTFYTALNMLGDSIPGLKYITKGDSLIFWGTGDPSFLHTDLKSTKAYEFLKQSSNKLFYSPDNFQGDFYGYGWAYSNYNDYYQADITALPLQDNVAIIYTDASGKLAIKPSFLQQYLQQDSSFKPSEFMVKRNIDDNSFIFPATPIPTTFKQEIPWKTGTALTLSLLQDTLKKPVILLKMALPDSAKTIYSSASNSVYKRMMLPSDNFIAEQLLLVCSSTISGTLSTDTAINYSIKHFLNDLPQKPIWVDGSGLSRQDLFTPQSIIVLLQKISDKLGNEQLLHDLFPAGGKTGTLRNAYKTDNGKPFVWAKTGTLSNNHNQSGYLITKKGKRLIFSYMNNNFADPVSDIRAEMVRVITEIHNKF